MTKAEFTIKPKLVVSDADAAIEFYRQAFGATVLQRYTMGDTVVFAELEMLGGRVTLKDEDATDPSPTTLGRPGVLIDVTHDDPDSVAQAVVDEGGSVVFEVGDAAYGARGGRVRDPFGHEWLVQTPLRLPPDRVQAALDETG
jgi:PhnB protein